MWEGNTGSFTWNKDAQKFYKNAPTKPDWSEMNRFLKARDIEMAGPIESGVAGWKKYELPKYAKADEHSDGDWKTAWHGSHIECLASTLHSRMLKESRDEARGERSFDNLPGVYLHGGDGYKTDTSERANNYLTFVSCSTVLQTFSGRASGSAA